MSDLTFADWKSKAAKLKFRNQCFISGGFCDAALGQKFETINPATGEVLTAVARGTGEDIDRAVKSARRAFDDKRWSAKPRQSAKKCC